jgi:hypothetical protein
MYKQINNNNYNLLSFEYLHLKYMYQQLNWQTHERTLTSGMNILFFCCLSCDNYHIINIT